MLSGLKVTVTKSRSSLDLAVKGEIDASTRDEFTTSVRKAILSGPRMVNLDLSNVEFLGSDGINALVRMRRLATDEGVSMRIVKSSRVVERVLDLMDLTDYFD